jgi:hypothetical protein
MKTTIVSSKVRGRSRCEHLALRGESALEMELSSKPSVGKGVWAQRRKHRCSVFNCESRSPHSTKNSLLSFELRFHTLYAASATVHAP